MKNYERMGHIMSQFKKGTTRIAAILIACMLSFALTVMITGCQSNKGTSSSDSNQSEEPSAGNDSTGSETRTFTDSLGRTVEVPNELNSIAPSGHTAQQVLLTIAPNKMVGLSMELDEYQLGIFGDQFNDLPVFGAAFGAKGDMNREAIAAAGAQIIIDTGESKQGLAEDLDALEQQMGIPCVFIETKLDDYGTAYLMLGELLGLEQRGQELSDYSKSAYDEVQQVMATIPESDHVEIAYLLGDAGLNAIAKDSYQGQVIDMVANNAVVVEDIQSTGMGNEISLEQIALWDPELIVFQKGSIYDSVADDGGWAALTAITQGNYYEVPTDPWCWLNNPPTVNQVMGMQWLPRLLYPDAFDTSIEDVTLSYYKTFYNYDLSDSELSDLTANALPK